MRLTWIPGDDNNSPITGQPRPCTTVQKRGNGSLGAGGLALVSGPTSASLDVCPGLLTERVEALVSLSGFWEEYQCLCLPKGDYKD